MRPKERKKDKSSFQIILFVHVGRIFWGAFVMSLTLLNIFSIINNCYKWLGIGATLRVVYSKKGSLWGRFIGMKILAGSLKHGQRPKGAGQSAAFWEPPNYRSINSIPKNLFCKE